MSFVTLLLTNAPSRRTVRRAALWSVVVLSFVAASGVARAQSAHEAHGSGVYGFLFAPPKQPVTRYPIEFSKALADYNRNASDASSGTTKLGALLREQLGNKSE